MSFYRILQNNNGFNVQKDMGKWEHSRYSSSYNEDWQTIITVKTLKAAKKVKESMEIANGRIVE